MTRRRDESFDLRQAIRTRSFTPRATDVAPLLDLLADEDARADAERALLRVPDAALAAALARLADPGAPHRDRAVRFLGRMAAESTSRRGTGSVTDVTSASQSETLGEAAAAILTAARDAEPRTRRAALIALGHLPAEVAEGPLLEALSRERAAGESAHVRSAAASLGKIGGPRAAAALRALPSADDPELARTVDRALLQLERDVVRATPGTLRAEATAERDLPLLLRCRAGLEPLVVAELPDSWRPRASARGLIAATLPRGQRLDAPFRSRIILGFGFPLQRGTAGDPVSALASDDALALLRRFTDGPIRYRVSFAGGGHRRAEVWRIARDVAARRPELVNDPTETLWEAVVSDDGRVVLEPRRLADPRFAYRKADVAGASHPTIAAALAHVAAPHPDDVVWDPFAGSGTELVECARLGATRLHGSDLDDAALAVARENLAAAGVRADLSRADATTHAPAGVTLIVTNPPMGRRVLERGRIPLLLDAFVDHAARLLPPGGRLVWISPLPSRTMTRAERAGLKPIRWLDVDMGGFTAQLQALARGGRAP